MNLMRVPRIKTLIAVLFIACPLITYAQAERTHTVQRGETLPYIAKRYGFTEQELKDANPGMNACYVGLKITIPSRQAVRETKAETAAVPNQTAKAAQQRPSVSTAANTASSTVRQNNTAGAASYSNVSPKSTTTAPAGNGVAKQWREELGYGGFVIVKQYHSGITSRIRYRQCPNCRSTKICASCHGSRRCSLCNGQGGIVTAGYGRYIPCTMCNRTGQCSLCKGSGRCVCATMEYPGYVIGSNATIYPDGRTERETADYNQRSGGGSSSKSSNSSGNSGKSSCYKCGGTGVDPSPSSGNLTSWLAHHNMSGTRCPYCKTANYTSHDHARCAHCNVPTH